MKRKLQGQYVPISTVGEQARAFVPADCVQLKAATVFMCTDAQGSKD